MQRLSRSSSRTGFGRFTRFVPGLILVGLILAPVSAKADTVFSNFGPGVQQSCVFIAGCAYNANSGWQIGPLGGALAAAFTPTETVTFNSVDLVMSWQGGNNHFVVSIQGDSGNQPGTNIESIDFNNVIPCEYGVSVDPATGICTFGSLVTGDSALHPVLTAGTQYWFVVSPFDNTGQFGWNLSLDDTGLFKTLQVYPGAPPNTWAPIQLSSPFTRGVFDVNSTSVSATVPEPTSILLLATAFAIVLGLARKKVIAGVCHLGSLGGQQ